MSVNLKSLIGKLNDTVRGALEGAAGLCLSRTHYDVEIEHFLMKLLDSSAGDMACILRHFEVDRTRLAGELTRTLDKFKSGNARTPSLSPTLVKMMTEAWTLGSIDFGSGQIRSGYTILALVSNEELSRLVRETSRELQKVNADALKKDFDKITATSSEDANALAEGSSGASTGQPGAPQAGLGGKTPNLDQYTVNLTENARKGKIDPVLARDFEIRQVVDILTRRRQNNPILVGEAGVGKTAVVEGFAARIVAGDVPDVLKKVTVRTLDLALLQAGAGVKGEFENRLKGLIAEVKNSPQPIILFIDEAHTMIGAGGQAGQGDAANLLKPALARGELRTVAATTWSEYKKYFEKDPALARRFQVVKVEEPGEAQCSVMLRGVVETLERHHKVRVLDEGLLAAVKFSHRYLPDRQLPDKAVSVLDTACARLALGQNTIPPAIEDATRTLDDIAVQMRVLGRESALGTDHSERMGALEEQKAGTEAKLAALKERWEKEKDLVTRIRELRGQIEAASAPVAQAAAAAGASEPAQSRLQPGLAAPLGQDEGQGDGKVQGQGDGKVQGQGDGKVQGQGDGKVQGQGDGKVQGQGDGKVEGQGDGKVQGQGDGQVPGGGDEGQVLRGKLSALVQELEQLQGENPLIGVTVDAQIVGEVISGWTGIPVGKMLKDEIATVLSLEKHLGARVIGQDHALGGISQRIRTSRARLDDPEKPVGVFLLVGPSGVGKTETALALSDLLYGGEQNIITINMSEFQEAHTVSTLKGSPPGYVGFGEGGVLTEAVRRRPYSVVLLDEIEKAHPDVLELFFQVFDKGRMEDGEGREIIFRNCIIILTSNAGTDTLMRLCADPETMPGPEGLVKALKPELDKVFKPAFLGRMVIIPFFPIRDEALRKIIQLKLRKIQKRIQETHRVSLTYDEALVTAVAGRCTEVESGARNVDNILTNTLLPDISKQLLGKIAEGVKPEAIHVTIGEDGAFAYR